MGVHTYGAYRYLGGIPLSGVIAAGWPRQEIGQGRLVAIPLVAPQMFRPVGILHRRRRKFNRATQLFLELLEEKPA